jgi:serine/threonine protein kinase
MAFIAKHTNILILKLYYYFEDDKAVYLIIEYIKGVGINKLKEEKWKFVEKELEVYLKVLKEMKLKF